MPEPDTHTGTTIAAVSTAWGEAGIAVLRVSGPGAIPLGRAALRFGPSGFPPPREMRLATLLDAEKKPIDRVLAVHFPAPRSYTGEDVLEIQTHGGALVARLGLDALLAHGARLLVSVRVAEPGEFTRRAFLNGRMDLAQAEAVLGVIQARSGEALRAAARTLRGDLSEALGRLRGRILALQGDLEVGLDFPEGEPPQVEEGELSSSIEGLLFELEELEKRCSTGVLLRDGIRVAILGRPNVGKSSLLNALLNEPRAIVTPIPGTTRDLVEGELTIRGVPLRLVDTAGIRDLAETPGFEVEAIGIQRAREAQRAADLQLWVLDGTQPLGVEDRDNLSKLNPLHSLIILNKLDLSLRLGAEELCALAPGVRLLSLSALTGDGLEALRGALADLALGTGALEEGLNVSARQLEEVRACAARLREAKEILSIGLGQDAAAGALGGARLALERLLGVESDGALLDSIFSRFCVGK